ncbi:hypothetical protein [Litchfieldia salsa]|uniref:Uncharacterized protein n=1 Tax=Litchfieldia salsa TaxID=930152 RepID=A0A1H0WGF4_9BACI|nr:hypothetical protein [Litchfieldia salsa]SDP89386.1 hypothetical protein SAMN05216565_11119 [Litchfieldia salsa]
MKKYSIYIMLIAVLILLTGCMYPDEKLVENQVPFEHQLDSVQQSVINFQEANGGLLPIKTREMDTPIYQKYPVDFNKLIPRFIGEPPGSAFESGGVYVYVLVDVETDPKVKLFDLTITEKIRELKLRLDVYRRENGYPPVKDVIDTNIFTLDYEKLGMKEELFVVSPFTGNNLPLVINNEVEVFVDYRIDLYNALTNNKHSFKPGEDIRNILVENSMFVPAHSAPYTINSENEPIFLKK